MCPQLHWFFFVVVFSSPLFFFSTLTNSQTHPLASLRPNPSMQNGAGRSSPADQNALFSEFSPFTRGEREAAPATPPPCLPRPAETQNTTPTRRGRAGRGLGGGGGATARWKTSAGRNEEEKEQTRHWHHRRRKTKMTCRHHKMSVRLSSYPGSRCQCLFVAHWALRQQQQTPKPPVQVLDTPSLPFSFYLHNFPHCRY